MDSQWFSLAPPLNPFDDLDNASIAYLLNFTEAPAALQLAKSCRRLYNIYSQNQNRRCFQRFDIVIVEFSEKEISWKPRLGNFTISQPAKPLYVKFVEKLLEDPDFVVTDGALCISVKLEQRTHPKFHEHFEDLPEWMYEIEWTNPMQTLMCHVEGGDERLGMLTLFKFLHERLDLDQLLLDKANAEALDFLAQHPLSVRHLHVFPTDSGTEDNLLRLLQVMPEVRELTIRGRNTNFSPVFYDAPAIRELQTFAFFEATCAADLTQMQWPNYIAPLFTATITTGGSANLIDEWKEGRREIGFWLFVCDMGTLSSGQAVRRILGDSVEVVPRWGHPVEAVVKSESDKKLLVTIYDADPGIQTIVLTTITNWKEVWDCFINTWMYSWETEL